MKILAALIAALILIFSAMSMVTSSSARVAQMAYGDTASGLLNNEIFDWAYEFEGEAGDTVLVELQVQPKTDYLDAQVYLINPAGEYLNSNIHGSPNHNYLLLSLRDAGTYMVVVERSGGRRGGGEGGFDLSLDRVDPKALDSEWSGVLDADQLQGFHLFHAEGTGTYRIDMGHADTYSPALLIMSLIPGQGYLNTIGEIDVVSMGRISFDLELQRGFTYVVLVSWPRYRTNNAATLPYSIRFTPVDVSPFWLNRDGALES